ncbi:hypothetical protein G6L30_08550 [Agrobacterium rhizogenes]|nr:hypothetical protein [Rhizobium rhizogenes]
MDIIGSIAVASQALDIVKKLRELDLDLKQAEIKLQLADLYGKLADVKIALSDAKTELQEKDQEIQRLTQKVASKRKTVSIGAYHFGIDDNGQPFSKAYCPNCEQTKSLQIPLTRSLANRNSCASCKSSFDPGETNLPPNFKMPEAL